MNTSPVGMDYYMYLRQLHACLRPRTYVEIGFRKGESFALAMPDTFCLGIDPAPQVQFSEGAMAKGFTMTSDEFFATRDLRIELNNREPDLAFIDGMHLFEYVLRDFCNIERYAGRKSVIVLHDCLPIDDVTSRRDRTTNVWTGDVWKMIFCLKKYRPDLLISLMDASPSGLAVITNLDPSNTVLLDRRKELEQEYIPMDFSHYEQNASIIRGMLHDFPSMLNFHQLGIRTSDPVATVNQPKCLAVLMCYNDADILGDVIEHFIANKHDILAWDHGSDDATPQVLDAYKEVLVEHRLIPRSFDFYALYQTLSDHLIKNYITQYDWISWPDQDELLEGPARDKSYYEYVVDVFNSPYDWVQFNNFNYWHVDGDDLSIASPTQRIRHYSLFPDCAPRIRAWRASVTNIREFNHNSLPGKRFPVMFNLRHYPARTPEQIRKRIFGDRSNLERNGMNYHYNNMKESLDKMAITANILHADDGISPLDNEPIFNWRQLYGSSSGK